ncbi:GNAT family N-acetyltransferase [Salinibacterium sp. NK8237]|uniref:GNAT family N-acetyltransferase n=1 Tax=Salinibacterium sp. NK8237 TaxID=2792038 RepID=UPI0018CFA85A|nr:GNAT family N-acetyltransferase [Salinibacterium sp. NK8237]MBH0130721.1 GNAT family N-acetyltransferase [Salinibacterium sp. NK8237]
MDVIVRRAVPDEWRAVQDIRLRALTREPSAFGSSAGGESFLTEGDWRQRIAHGFSVLAWADEEPIGMVSGIVKRETGGHELVGMWVDPEQRGTGVATLVVDAMCA